MKEKQEFSATPEKVKIAQSRQLLEDNEYYDPFEKIRHLRVQCPKNIIVSYININSVRHKFNNFVHLIKDNVDVLVFAEAKLDGSFQDAQFLIPGFKKPYRLDISGNSSGMPVFVNESIPSRKLDGTILPSDIQAIPIELNLRKNKWLLLPIYQTPCQNEYVFNDHMEKVINFYSGSLDNVLIFGDFNMETTHTVMIHFLENHNLYSMIKSPTCFKSVKG